MKLKSPLNEIYSHDKCDSDEKLHDLTNRIIFAPLIFQVSRLTIKWGILKLLDDNKNGLSLKDIEKQTNLSQDVLRMLLSVSLIAQTVLYHDDMFFLAKTGWFLLHDKMVEIHMNLNHEMNYIGFFDLEKAILEGKPAGLKHLGNWPTLYEGLSSFPDHIKNTWLTFDHFYSDNAFEQALEIIFFNQPKKLLDVGGNTGNFATQCISHDNAVEVTIMDLPQQLEMMRQATAGLDGANRIHGHGCNLLDESTAFPTGFDAIWMSQFLDCFSEEQVCSILRRAAQSMTSRCKLYIMETFWDRQTFETASYCLAQISLYFTAMANGNSKMYYSEDMIRCIEQAGLQVAEIHDHIGLGHSILECRKK